MNIDSVDNAKNLKVSIILPTRNRAPMLHTSLNSIIKQTYANFELIAINDCSSDNTLEELRSFERIDDRVRVYSNEHGLGLPASRNKGVLLSKGSLIFFIEDDLVLDDDCLLRLVESFKNLSKTNYLLGAVGPRLITMCDSNPEINDAQEQQVVNVSRLTGDIKCNFGLDTKKIQEVVTLHSCSLIERKAFLKVGGFETNLYRVSYVREETDFYFRLKQNGFRLFFEPRAIAYHHTGRIGGCILRSKFWQEYYNVRNHLTYLIRFYGISTFFMYPCFLTRFLLSKFAARLEK